MKKIFLLFVLTGLFFLMQPALSAQVRIAFSAPKDSFELGEDIPVELVIRLEDERAVIKKIRFSVLDSMSIMKYLFPEDSLFMDAQETDFEIADYGRWVNNQKNEFSEKDLAWDDNSSKGVFANKLLLKIWDSGTFRVMITELQYEDKSGKTIRYFPKTNEAQIVFIQQPSESEITDLAPIDPIIKRSFPEFYFRYILLFFSFIVLIYTLIDRFRKRPVKDINWQFPEKSLAPAHEIALKKLIKLSTASYHQKDEIKLFYSELSYILREYIESRYRIPALESTTVELINALFPGQLNESLKNRLHEILVIADLVKFAKAEPPSEVHISMLQQAMEFVENTKLTEFINRPIQ